MISPTSSTDVTVRDVLNGLEAMEKWTRQLREALSTLDHDQRLAIKQGPKKDVPLVSAGQCPGPNPSKNPKPSKKKKKR